MPGRWDFSVAPTAQLYPVSMTMHGGAEHTAPGRADTWNEFLLGSGRRTELTVTMASGAAGVRGKVTRSLGEPAPGAPVYLEAFDIATGQRLADLRQTLTDPRGEYRFAGLTPGSYRIVSSFDFKNPDERTMEAARARIVSVKASEESVEELELFSRP